MNARLTHAVAVLLTAASLIIPPLYAQQAQPQDPMAGSSATQPQTRPMASAPSQGRALTFAPDYSLGRSWFPHFTAPYRPLKIPEPMLTNSPRVDQLIQNGKLMITLEDAISLALENNMDIAVQRFTPWLDEANLLRAKSGVNGRLVFDPIITGTGYISQASVPINNPFLAGVGTSSTTNVPVAPNLISHNGVANFTYTQGFSTGTQIQTTFANNRSSINFPADLFNPYAESSLTVQITQPLFNGFGKLPNTRYILEARNTVKVGESQFAQQVINTVTQVSTDYWELVYARENVKVEQATVAVDQQLYDNNKKQLEIGTMAPLDVITAESQLASDQQALVQAQTTQLQDETTLLVAITKDPLAMSLSGVEIVPTTPISTPEVVENISLQDAVKEAWQKRPELQQAALNLKNAGIEVKATKNELLPTVNLFGLYEQTGIAGVSRTTDSTAAGFISVPTEPILFANGSQATLGTPAEPIFVGAQVFDTTHTVHTGGLIDTWNNMIHNNYPTYEAGINLTLPIRNRSAQADNAQATLVERQQGVQYRQTQNTIVLNVRQALTALAQDRAAVTAAEKAETLASQTLDDEQKKYTLGSSTSYNVVLRSRDLTAAQGTLLRDRINLIEAEVNFNQAMGRTLDVNHITLADARSGRFYRVPNIPGSMDAGTVQGK
ncbi:MAG TPA: TolC family protein [Candidatus Acidoferrales bacterium]|nr:TolC family protein [Candidatus Acidoferrales bacterium]